MEVSPLTKEQLKWSDYRKVPVALLDGEQVVDSTAIITRLAAELAAEQQQTAAARQPARRSWLSLGRSRHVQQVCMRHSLPYAESCRTLQKILLCTCQRSCHAAEHAAGQGPLREPSACLAAGERWRKCRDSVEVRATEPTHALLQADASAGSSAAGSEDEERWRRWVDERLVRLLTVNIYRSAHEAFQTFDYIADTGKFTWVEREAARVVGAAMMWGISGRLRKKYGIEGDVRQQLYAAADEWADALGDARHAAFLVLCIL